ncbi:MAG: type B 50S ribosomal protein L31 [Candidatus Pacebacteria bacterium]|nr:type B 50S ribosomal protein L31 [Candidatus Paceibacterota bacterium]
MKKDIHPKNSRKVIFEDSSTKEQFLLLSCVETTENGVFEADKKEYPLYRIEISSASHPFYTGKSDTLLDTAGRVDRFKKRQAAVKK